MDSFDEIAGWDQTNEKFLKVSGESQYNTIDSWYIAVI